MKLTLEELKKKLLSDEDKTWRYKASSILGGTCDMEANPPTRKHQYIFKNPDGSDNEVVSGEMSFFGDLFKPGSPYADRDHLKSPHEEKLKKLFEDNIEQIATFLFDYLKNTYNTNPDKVKV